MSCRAENGKRDVYDRGVQHHHELGKADGAQDEPAAEVGGCAGPRGEQAMHPPRGAGAHTRLANRSHLFRAVMCLRCRPLRYPHDCRPPPGFPVLPNSWPDGQPLEFLAASLRVARLVINADLSNNP